ncbi:hypothetical protein ABIA39_001086 [Nocardia sp. GAS34]
MFAAAELPTGEVSEYTYPKITPRQIQDELLVSGPG